MIATEANGLLFPTIKASPDDLGIATNHLANGDLRAASVYARAAFESRIKKVCDKKGIKVAYKRDPNELSIDALWSGIKQRQIAREAIQRSKPTVTVPDFISNALILDVEGVRSKVLNALSHANPPNLDKSEVD